MHPICAWNLSWGVRQAEQFSIGSLALQCKYQGITKLTPWKRIILKNLKVPQLIKFLTFHGTQRFITIFTRAHHWSLSWARRIHILMINFNIILPPMPGSFKCYHPFRFTNKNFVCISYHFHAYYMPCLFKVALKKYLNTHSYYSVEEFLAFKNDS